MASSNANSGPPPTNPILTTYLSFVQSTPLVTRYVITAETLSYLVSFFVDPSFALSNIPFFTLFKFELYRLVFSPLICTGILSLLFAYLGFIEHGKRLEYSMGSSSFAVLLLTLGMTTNISFCVVSVVLYILTGSDVFLHLGSETIWIVLLALIAVECSQAPEGTKRRLFVVEVPTLYYPCAILVLFTLLGGLRIPYFLSVGVGYAYGKGKLDHLKVSSSRISVWEGNDGCLSNFTRREGWVVGHAATGSGAWSTERGGENSGGSWQPTSFFRGERADGGGDSSAAPSSGGGTVASAPGGGSWKKPGEVKKPSFPQAGGRTLGESGSSTTGIASRRRNNNASDAREAMLAAAERRNAGGGDSQRGAEEEEGSEQNV